MNRKGAFFSWIAAAMLAGFSMMLLGGPRPAAAQSIQIGAHHAKFYIVFLDETGSRGKQWPEMVEKAVEIASRLKNQDGIAVIGIDDHGGDEDDVRVPLTIVQTRSDLDMAGLKRQRDAIIEQVRSLKPRGRPRRTDIVGAVKQAQGLANMVNRSMNILLFFFSDMQQTPKMPDAASFRGIQFPQGTKGYCFYVAASAPGRDDLQPTIDLWYRLLNSAGVAIAKEDFHQQGTVDFGLNNALKY